MPHPPCRNARLGTAGGCAICRQSAEAGQGALAELCCGPFAAGKAPSTLAGQAIEFLPSPRDGGDGYRPILVQLHPAINEDPGWSCAPKGAAAVPEPSATIEEVPAEAPSEESFSPRSRLDEDHDEPEDKPMPLQRVGSMPISRVGSMPMTRKVTDGSISFGEWLGLSNAWRLAHSSSSVRGSAFCSESMDTRRDRDRHPLQDHTYLLACFKLLRAEALADLPDQLPRCQDLKEEAFGAPQGGDVLIAVSHGWRNQGHPDPDGRKKAAIQRLMPSNTEGNQAFIFLDFASMSQRPFKMDQADRTADEDILFTRGLKCMHEMFFLADYTIHLNEAGGRVEGEGDAFHLTGDKLRRAQVAQIGEWVQVIGATPEPESRASALMDPTGSMQSMRPRRQSLRRSRQTGMGSAMGSAFSIKRWHTTSSNASTSSEDVHTGLGFSLFDRIEAIDGRAVHHASEVHELLRDPEAEAHVVRLRRYPYGRVNSIPLSERGWVFLERFTTMVKCAMMQDEEQALGLVVSDSEAVLREILDGAARLREAAATGVLNEVLAEFVAELQTKRFSGASTDKLLIDANSHMATSESAGLTDVQVVEQIMQRFVKHLGTHWEREAVLQRKRATMMGHAWTLARDFLLGIDCFSEEFSARLAAVELEMSDGDGGGERRRCSLVHMSSDIAAIVVAPLAVSLVVPLLPFQPPRESFEKQGLWFAAWFFLVGSGTLAAMPYFVAVASGLHIDDRLRVRMMAWVVVTNCITTGGLLSISAIWNIFPVPFAHMVAAVLVLPTLPLLWRCAPDAKRQEPDFRWRFWYAFLTLMATLFSFSVVFPMWNELMRIETHSWQPVLVLYYLLSKMLVQRINGLLLKRLGADIMPLVTFFMTYAYEVNMCVVLLSGFHWWIPVALIAFNILENAGHMWTLWRLRAGVDTKSARRRQFIMATSSLRQFVEVMVPCQYMAVMILVFFVQPRFYEDICHLEARAFGRRAVPVLANLFAEVCFGLFSYGVMRRLDGKPWCMLRALTSMNLLAFLFSATTCLMYHITIRHSHFGCDMSFKFIWLADKTGGWECGLDYDGDSWAGDHD